MGLSTLILITEAKAVGSALLRVGFDIGATADETDNCLQHAHVTLAIEVYGL